MATFQYPINYELSVIAADYATRARAARRLLSLFPEQNTNAAEVRWYQPDNVYGLMGFRGYNNEPAYVKRLGSNLYVYQPGVYGEATCVDERELTTRASFTPQGMAIPVSDLVMMDQQLLMGRMMDRQENNAALLLTTGTLTVANQGPTGTNVYTDTYSLQTYTAAISWTSFSTATPIANLQAIQQLEVGHSVDLGAGAAILMNQQSANLLLNNTNASDIAGRRNQYGATLNNLGDMNNYFKDQNLPSIEVYDQGFQLSNISGPITNNAQQFQKFIPYRTGIVVGKRRDGQPIGHMQYTKNLMGGSDGIPPSGFYSYVKNSATGSNAPMGVPKLETHVGFNGGLVIEYATSVVSFNF